jgi:hypothetical protein
MMPARPLACPLSPIYLVRETSELTEQNEILPILICQVNPFFRSISFVHPSEFVTRAWVAIQAVLTDKHHKLSTKTSRCPYRAFGHL